MRIGQRNDRLCANIRNGGEIPWLDEISYIVIFIVRLTNFRCSLDHAKRSFYRAVNSIFA